MTKQLQSVKPNQSDKRPVKKINLGDLTPRERGVLELVGELSGGPVATAQISFLLWPQSVSHKLVKWQLSQEDIKQIQSEYQPHHIVQRLDLGKWLRQLRITEPEIFANIDRVWTEDLQRPQIWLDRVLKIQQLLPQVFVERLVHPSTYTSKRCTKTLARLKAWQLLDSDELPTRGWEGRGQKLWFLTPRGRRLAVASLLKKYEHTKYERLPVQAINLRRPGQFSDMTLWHHLQNTDVQLAIRVAAARLGYQVIYYMDDIDLRKLFSNPKHQVEFGMKERPLDEKCVPQKFVGATVMDQFCILKKGDNEYPLLVELCRAQIVGRYSSLGRRDYRRKIHIISAMYKSGLYHKLFPEAGNSFRYLTVTTGGVDFKQVDRVQTLKRICEEVVAEVSNNKNEYKQQIKKFWFGRFNEVVLPTIDNYFCPYTILDIRRWHQAGSSRVTELIKDA